MIYFKHFHKHSSLGWKALFLPIYCIIYLNEVDYLVRLLNIICAVLEYNDWLHRKNLVYFFKFSSSTMPIWMSYENSCLVFFLVQNAFLHLPWSKRAHVHSFGVSSRKVINQTGKLTSQLTGTLPKSKKCEHIEVSSGSYFWESSIICGRKESLHAHNNLTFIYQKKFPLATILVNGLERL